MNSSLSIPELVRSLGQRVEREWSDRLASTGLHVREAELLGMLEVPRAQRDIAVGLGVSAAAVVAIVDSLEERGAVTRRRDGADRRRQFVELTEAGRRLRSECREVARAQENRFVRSLSAGEVALLRETLETLARDDAARSVGSAP